MSAVITGSTAVYSLVTYGTYWIHHCILFIHGFCIFVVVFMLYDYFYKEMMVITCPPALLWKHVCVTQVNNTK